MNDTKKMIAIISVAGMIVFSIPLVVYLNNLSSQAESQKEIKLKELETQDRQDERDTTEKYFNSVIEISKLLAKNKNIQDASKFEYVPPVIDDIEEEIIDLYYIDNYHFRSENKSFKLAGMSKEINSITITPEKRMQLIVKAENQEQVKLKIKLIKDAATSKIKEAYLLDYIEN